MNITAPNADVQAQARERFDALAKPVGSLGRLEQLGSWWAGCVGECPPPLIDNIAAVIPAGDHGIVNSGVAAYPREITTAMVRTIHAGLAGVNVLARQHGVPLDVLDISVDHDFDDLPEALSRFKIRRGSGPIDTDDAMTNDECERAFVIGEQIVTEHRRRGTQLLIVGDLGIGNTTPSAALIAKYLGLTATDTCGRGAGVDDAGLARKVRAVDAALTRTTSITDPIQVLTALGSPDLAVGVGVMISAAKQGLPVMLDGVISVAEALAATMIAPGAQQWFVAGHRSVEPAQSLALAHLRLEPILDLGMRLGEGSGAMAAVPLLRSSVKLLNDMALLADLMPSPGE